MKLSSRGFTLVELMIVIAIIGILAAALFPSLTAYLKRSRDAGRSANLNTVATAIGAFYSDREIYPQSSSGCVDSTLLSTNYLPKGVPVDSQTANRNGCGAPVSNYGYGGTGHTTGNPGWTLMAFFENANGGNSTPLQSAGWTGNLQVSQATINTAINATNSKGTGAVFVMTN